MAPPTPSPPVITRAPVVWEVLAVVLVKDASPDAVKVPVMMAFPEEKVPVVEMLPTVI